MCIIFLTIESNILYLMALIHISKTIIGIIIYSSHNESDFTMYHYIVYSISSTVVGYISTIFIMYLKAKSAIIIIYERQVIKMMMKEYFMGWFLSPNITA